MKPKYNRFTRQIPAAIVAVASLQSVHATVLDDDSQGNFSITAPQTTANSILANGGFDPNNTVFVGSSVNLTGDAMSGAVLNINTAGNYTVTNNGSLSGTNAHGIQSSLVISLTNNGTILGGTTSGKRGIETLGGSTIITNSSGAVISGTNDAIRFTTTGGTVNNSGSITGISGTYSDGISGKLGDLTVTNNSIISGNHKGINSGDSLDLTNNNGGTITGNNDAGVFAGDTALINNYGSITSAEADGVSVGDDATIHNNTTYTGGNSFTSAFISGATGGEDSGSGVTAGDNLILTNDYHSTISGKGKGGDGVSAGYNLRLTNGGLIDSDEDDAISAGNSSTITNDLTGRILGEFNGISFIDDGIQGDDNGESTIINHGDIIGYDGAGIIAGNYSQIVTNDGYISGDEFAIDLGGGNDTVNLNLGSEISGDISLGNGSGIETDTINFGAGKTSPEGTSNVVYGDISGVEVINKDGEGAAFVGDPGDGYEVAADEINVYQGALYINGDVHESNEDLDTQINAYGAEIGGEGTWNANILVDGSGMWAPIVTKIPAPFTVAGVLSPGGTPIDVADDVDDAIGTLVVVGDVTMTPDSIYRGDVNPISGDQDFLQLTGSGHTFTAGGATLEISPTNVNAPIHDGSGVIIETDAQLGGDTDVNAGFGAIALYHSTNTPDLGLFQAQSNPSAPIITEFLKLTTSLDGTDVVATLTHDYGKFGSTPNEVAAGAMLDGLVEGATGDVADLLASLDYSDAATTEAALAALDPGSYFATAAALANSNYGLHRTVENHNAAVRSDSGSVMSAPAPAPASSAKGAITSEPTATGCTGTSNVWGSVSYDWLDVNGASGQSGDVASFTAGIDFLVAQNFRLGLVAQGAYSEWDGGSGTDSSIDTYRLAAYANWGAATGWFVDALVGYNGSSVDQSRNILLGNVSSNQSGSYDADGWQGLLTVGNTIATTSAGNFAPFIGVEMQSFSTDSFTASGPLPVDVGSMDIDSIRGLVGVKWDMQVAQNLKTYASVAYAYEFEDDASDTKVSFGGGSYKAYGAEPGDAILVSAGLRWNVVTCTTIDFGYRGEFATDDGVDSHGVNVGVNYSF